MSSDPIGNSGASLPKDLQFERAEPVSGRSEPDVCAACHSTLVAPYYRWSGVPVCSGCVQRNRLDSLEQPSGQDYVRALLYGAGAALAGTGLYFLVLAISGYEIGLLAVAVGWMVGKAVQKGSRGVGGRRLQVLAVLLTYLSIAGSYVPLILRQAFKEPPAKQATSNRSMERSPAEPDPETASPAASISLIGFMVLFAYCLALPFLQGWNSIIGLFIMGIGLFEAWKLNKRIPAQLSGPYPAPGDASA